MRYALFDPEIFLVFCERATIHDASCRVGPLPRREHVKLLLATANDTDRTTADYRGPSFSPTAFRRGVRGVRSLNLSHSGIPSNDKKKDEAICFVN